MCVCVCVSVCVHSFKYVCTNSLIIFQATPSFLHVHALNDVNYVENCIKVLVTINLWIGCVYVCVH